jgi:endonuclease/exonuclease/phosphatase family metal-dependent hydrolase
MRGTGDGAPSELEMRVLSWNLFHGRSLLPARRDLMDAFAELIAGWEWDVALLQEVPPWWPANLAQRARARYRRALTSRNSLLPLRRPIAERRPELAKSNGGGCNAVLARTAIREHRALRLRSWPERRVAQLVRVSGGVCVANYHASTRVALAEDELARLWREALAFAAGDPLILGGDLNLRTPLSPPAELDAVHLARRDVDHLFGWRMALQGEARVLDRHAMLAGRSLELSDHPPLLVDVRPVRSPAGAAGAFGEAIPCRRWGRRLSTS